MVTIKKIKISTMRTIPDAKERKAEKQKQRMISGSPLLIILYILGMTGIAFTVLDIIGLQITGFYLVVMAVMALIVTGFWFLYTRHGRTFIIVTALLTGVSAILLVPQVYRLTVRIKIMVKYNIPLDNLSVDTVFILILVLLAIFFLFSLEFVIRNHSIMVVAGLALLILVPVFGRTMNPIYMIMLIIFEAGFIVVNMSERKSGRGVMQSSGRPKINILSTILAICIVFVTLLPSFVIEAAGEKSLYLLAYDADSFIKDTIARITGSSLGSGFNDGSVSRGNLFQSSLEQLTVTLDEPPSGTLYLKGYTGQDYSSSNWSSAFNVTESISGSITYCESCSADLVYNTYTTYSGEIPFSFYYLGMGSSDPISDMYFMLAPDTALNDQYFFTENEGGRTFLMINPEQEITGYLSNNNANYIIIDSLNESIENHRFIPYGAKDSLTRIRNYSNYYSAIINSYTNSYLDFSEMDASDKLSEESVFTSMLARYKSIIQESYTRYPTDQQRLIDYCRSTPLDRLDDITTYILVTLQNKANYSTTPGNTPYNKDVVDYFLFDNGQGYCVHFASAAAMMYRMYGIPSRYVTGFVAQPYEFKKPDGSDRYSVTLTGKAAHAWVEIFLDDYGWVPVEVTPTLQGTMHCEYPGYDESTMRASMARHGWSFKTQTASDTGGTGFFGLGAANPRAAAASSFIFLIIGAAGALVFFIIRRRVIMAKLSTLSCRRLFDRIIRLLHHSGAMKEYTGSENDFAEALSKELECMDIASASKLIRIMLEVNYSDRKVSLDDRNYIEQCYRIISAELYSKASLIKKPIYRFIYACPTK